MATAIPARSSRLIHAAAAEAGGNGEVSMTRAGGTRGRSVPIVHSQVRRIREEDLRIGDDAGEGLRCVPVAVVQVGSRVGGAIQLCSRPWMLPCSPLGNKAAAV